LPPELLGSANNLLRSEITIMSQTNKQQSANRIRKLNELLQLHRKDHLLPSELLALCLDIPKEHASKLLSGHRVISEMTIRKVEEILTSFASLENELANICDDLGDLAGVATLSSISPLPEGCTETEIESLILSGELEEFRLHSIPLKAFARGQEH